LRVGGRGRRKGGPAVYWRKSGKEVRGEAERIEGGRRRTSCVLEEVRKGGKKRGRRGDRAC
jgi:hypothetical protein